MHSSHYSVNLILIFLPHFLGVEVWKIYANFIFYAFIEHSHASIQNILIFYLVHGINDSGANQKINFLGSENWASTFYHAEFAVPGFDLYTATGPLPFDDHFWSGGYGHNPTTGKCQSYPIQISKC